MRHLANAHSVTGPAGSVYTGEGHLFLAFGGTSHAIVHWIGCINTKKSYFEGLLSKSIVTRKLLHTITFKEFCLNMLFTYFWVNYNSETVDL